MSSTSKNGEELPPHSLEAEAGILACAILRPAETGELREDWFYDQRHRAAYRVLRDMAEQRQPIDPVSFATWVRKCELEHECGGSAYVSALPDKTGSGLEADYFGPILEEMRLRRAMLKLSVQMVRKAHDRLMKTEDLLGWFHNQITALDPPRKRELTTVELVRQVQQEIDGAAENKGRLRGIPTGFRRLDHLTGGLRAGQLCIVAARPAMGKTSLAMNIAAKVAIERREPVLVFSLEMAAVELMRRLICTLSETDLARVNRNELGQHDYAAMTEGSVLAVRADLPIVEGKLLLMQLMARAKRQRPCPALVVVDYLQMIRTYDGHCENSNEELTEVSNDLKGLAVELGCPVLATSQLNRDCERHDREPILSDLRGSGAIEQAADWVLLLHKAKDADRDEPEVRCILDKHRNGPTGSFKLTFERRFTRFVDIKGKGDE